MCSCGVIFNSIVAMCIARVRTINGKRSPPFRVDIILTEANGLLYLRAFTTFLVFFPFNFIVKLFKKILTFFASQVWLFEVAVNYSIFSQWKCEIGNVISHLIETRFTSGHETTRKIIRISHDRNSRFLPLFHFPPTSPESIRRVSKVTKCESSSNWIIYSYRVLNVSVTTTREFSTKYHIAPPLIQIKHVSIGRTVNLYRILPN